MTTLDIELREATLKHLIVEAGTTALRFFQTRKAGDYELKGHQDLLTEADTFVEGLLSDAISEAFPNDLILGEESARPPANAESLWVIDPIDGTANFARGISHFCLSIAWVRDGITELGAIYHPISQELYLARRGHYALKNDQPLHCSPITDMQHATVEFGWSSRHSQGHYLKVMAAMLQRGASVCRRGSGALALAWVAEGRTDGYAEIHMNAWDCLAGLLLVREAGGQTGSLPTDAEAIFRGIPVLAAAPGIAGALAQATGISLATMQLPAGGEKSLTTRYPRPPISLIVEDFPGWGVNIYIGDSKGVSDTAQLAERDIGIVINCAVNLDIDWVTVPEPGIAPHQLPHGSGPVRYYKLGLVDGDGNAPEMLHAGYQLMRSALQQQIPDKPSYRNPKRGNILINCRGGRSRSVALVALFLHLECPEQFPTLDEAIALIRDKRQLHSDEWFETPKPSLIQLAEQAILRERAITLAERPNEP